MPPTVKAGQKRFYAQPYVFSSQLATFGGTQVNQGAVVAGGNRQFPQADFNNSTSRPFTGTRMKWFVGRVAGGDEVDSDYNEVTVRVNNTFLDTNYSKNAVPLSVLLDRQRREWLLEPGRIILGTQNGGLIVDITVNGGSLGAPFNVSAALLGNFESYTEVTQSEIPPGQE